MCYTDIEFRRTLDGIPPVHPSTSLHLNDGDASGRGSIVFFNEATTYQTAELRHRTKKEALNAGVNVKRDLGTDVNAAFHSSVRFFPTHPVDGDA